MVMDLMAMSVLGVETQAGLFKAEHKLMKNGKQKEMEVGWRGGCFQCV